MPPETSGESDSTTLRLVFHSFPLSLHEAIDFTFIGVDFIPFGSECKALVSAEQFLLNLPGESSLLTPMMPWGVNQGSADTIIAERIILLPFMTNEDP